MASALDVAEGTVYRIKRRYADAGLEGVLHDRVQANRFRKLDAKAEAHLIALACSDAPEGHQRWTLQLPSTPIRCRSCSGICYVGRSR